MSTPNTKREQLIAKLKEMFQMDQADLDFGIYRIMNAKRDEVERFLDKDLLPTLRTTLEEFQPAGLAEKRQALDEAIKSAKSLSAGGLQGQQRRGVLANSDHAPQGFSAG
jgi:adenine-specific DNA-methyltransferase